LSSERRNVLRAGLGAALVCLVPARAAAQNKDGDPHNLRPQEGDRLVFADGERKGKPVAPDDLPLGGPPAIAYPQDPASGIVRDATHLNQVMLIRLAAADLAEASRARAPEGVIGYSAVCPHAGCFDWGWEGEKKMLRCPCHESIFDAKDDARVVDGPAPRRLARLPLKVVDGVLVAAGGFVGRVGFQPTG